MVSKSFIVCSLVYCTTWCATTTTSMTTMATATPDNQDITVTTSAATSSDDDTDSEMSATIMSDNASYKMTTESTSPPITTVNNEYFILSASTVPRDRMGPSVNSPPHYHLNHKDKPKSTEENIILRAPLPLLSSTSTPVTETSLTHSVGAIAKPTKYHYYPHNQHMYLLPECAVQQVCSAVYVRLNYTQPLCACPSRYREPCSASLNSDDLHTTELSVDSKGKVLTLVKTCEPVKEMRLCRAPRDWSLLALQNVRTGKSHYLVICHCPETSILEGPTSHDQPTYASVPGIKVYGMVCISKPDPLLNDSQHKRKVRLLDQNEEDISNDKEKLSFPYLKLKQLLKYVNS